jgi:hypothetical protein
MQLREQTAGNSPPILRTHRPPPAPPPVARQGTRQATPARKGVGTQAGLHPEDEPYQTTRNHNRHPAPIMPDVEDEDDEIYTQARMPTMVRKYNQPVDNPAYAQTPARQGGRRQPVTQVRQETPVRRLLPTHFLLTVMGVFLLVIVLALFLTTYVFPAIRKWNDDRVYGYPRTLHARASVGHGTRDQPYSDFVGENVQGNIYVVEIGEAGTTPTLVHAYYIIRLTGEGNDLTSITAITFSDLNGDGRQDMLVTLENGSTFVMYNTGTSFSQQDPMKK